MTVIRGNLGPQEIKTRAPRFPLAVESSSPWEIYFLCLQEIRESPLLRVSDRCSNLASDIRVCNGYVRFSEIFD